MMQVDIYSMFVQTCVMLGIRFGTHRACMSGKSYATTSKRLCDHFSSGPCKGSEHFVQDLEKWEEDGHLPRQGGVDRELSKRGEKQEDQWTLKLCTLYPYGLNDTLRHEINAA